MAGDLAGLNLQPDIIEVVEGEPCILADDQGHQFHGQFIDRAMQDGFVGQVVARLPLKPIRFVAAAAFAALGLAVLLAG